MENQNQHSSHTNFLSDYEIETLKARLLDPNSKINENDIQQLISEFEKTQLKLNASNTANKLKDALLLEQYLVNELMRKLPDYVYFKDKESRFVKISEAHAKSFKLNSVEEAIGKTDFDFFSEEHAQQAFTDEQEIIRSGKPLQKEERETWPDRPDTWVSTTKFPFISPDGDILGTFGISIDITKHKQSEKALLESQERYRLALQATQDGIWERNLITNESVYSSRWCEILGYSCDDPELPHTYQSWAERIHPDDSERVIAALNNYIETGSEYKVEYRHLHKSGEYRWQKSTGTCVFDNDGKVVKIVGCISDITERKRSEIALRESEVQYKNLANSGMALIWASGPDKLCNYFNEPWLKFTGRTLEQELGNGWADGVHPDDLDRCLETYRTAFDRREPFTMEYRLRHVSGEYRWMWDMGMSNCNSSGEFVGYIGHCLDITERKLAEQVIRDSNDRLRIILENNPIAIWDWDLQTDKWFATQNYYTMLGYEYEAGFPDRELWLTRVHPDDRETLTKKIADVLNYNSENYSYDARMLHADGHYQWQSVTGHVIERDVEGHPKRMIGVRIDINDRKIIEENLRLSEETFRSVFENSVVGKSITTLDGLVRVNKAFSDITGYTPEELTGMSWKEFTYKDDIEFNAKEIQSLLNGEKQFSQWEKRYIHKDGHLVWVNISVVLLRDVDGNPIQFVAEVINITKRKKAEEDLSASEERFRMLAENSIDVIWKMSMDGRFNYVSPSVFQLRGFTPDEVLQQTMQDAICPGSIALIQDALALAMAGSAAEQSRSIFFPIEQPCKDGTTIWTEATARVVYDNVGRPIEIVGVSRDISERRILEQEREQFFKFFQISSDIMVIADPQGAFIKVNPCTLKMLGYSEAELVSKSFVEFIHKDDRQNTMDEMERQMKIGSSINFVNRYVCKDGRILWLSWIANYKKDEGVTYATARDITVQLEAEMELKSNRDVLNKLLFANNEFIDWESETVDYKNFSDTILEISGAKYASFNIYDEDDLDFTTVAVSGIDALQEKVKSILGFELVNKKWKQDSILESKLKDKISIRYDSLSELVGYVLPKKLSVMIEKMFNIGETWIVQITKKNKTIGDFTLLFTKGDTIKNREIVELYASQVGLYLERLKSENALRISEDIYRNLVMKIPDGVYKSTVEGKFLEVNPAIVRMLGYDSKEEMLQMDIISNLYFKPSDRKVRVRKDTEDIISVFQLKKKDGSGIWIEDHGWYNTDMQGNIISHEGVLRDITERKKAEDAIKQSERLLRESQAVAKLGSYSWDITTGNWTSSQIMDDIFGIDENYIRSTEGWLALIHPDWKQEMSDYINNNILGKHQRFDKEYKIVRNDDGQECWVHGLGQLEFDEFNKPVKLIGTITNVDERKFAEIALHDKMTELMNFQRLTVGRELSMIELKKEINRLHEKMGVEPKYRIIE